MANEKGFLEVFTRYTPTEDKRLVLQSATRAAFRYSKEPIRFEVELSFPSHIGSLLYLKAARVAD